MELKITHTAAETLNDIILNALQEQGIEKAEAMEKELFTQITALPDADDSETATSKIILPGGPFAFVYRHTAESKLLLAIVHTSRLPQAVNS